MADVTPATAFLVAADIVQQSGRGQNIQACIHCAAHCHGRLENPLTVVRTVGSSFLQTVLFTYPVQRIQQFLIRTFLAHS
jgi:hypothetical protein